MTMFTRHISVYLLIASCVLFVTAAGESNAKEIAENDSLTFKGKTALFEFDNYSNDRDALSDVMPFLKSRLEEKGIEVVDRVSLNDFLCSERVRATGYISADLAQKVKKKFMADTILLGTIFLFSRGETPVLGIAARLLDSSNGTIVWADYASATGDDFTRILGLGKIKSIYELIPRVVDTLLFSLPVELPYERIEPAHKIAIMPFKNNTGIRGGGVIAMYLFLTEIFKNHALLPVEYGMVREFMVKNRIYPKGELDYSTIGYLSEQLEADAVLLGTLETYSDGHETSSPPEVAISTRLLNATSNNIEWYGSYQLDGEDDIIVFEWGEIKSVDKVAQKAVLRLLEKMEKKNVLKELSSQR